MFNDWCLPSDNLRLSYDLQLLVSRAALRHAAAAIASQADQLAEEMDSGMLSDEGGPEALRLLAAVVRASGDSTLEGAGLDGTGREGAGLATVGHA
jgi:hypothetical protein